MITFEPQFTEAIIFDLECYVPPEDQDKQGRSSLVFNAANPEHFILGGVFMRLFPMRGIVESPWQVWNFERNCEKAILSEIYDYFDKSWQIINGRDRRVNPDLILIGTGISRHDIPALYERSVIHNIASKELLYETYFKAKTVDLGEASIPLFRKDKKIYPLYPKNSNELLSELGVKSTKSSGTKVWKMFELADFEGIRNRTIAEVNDALAIANELIKRCRSN